MQHYVYEITNLINGKKYIGKRSCHCPIGKDRYMGSGALIRQALKKYGKENFKKDILFICNSSEEAYKIEKREIEKVNANKSNDYYNLAIGGKGGMEGFVFSQESREKMRKAQLGKKLPLDVRRKISNSNKGKTVSEETRYKISVSNIGLKRSEQARQNMSKACKGRIITENARIKIGLAHKGKTVSEETRYKISQANKGRLSPMLGVKMLEETKERISKANKGKVRSLETRLKLSESRKGHRLSEEQKAKLSEIRKGKINLGSKNGMYGKTGSDNPTSKKVICTLTGEVFGSMHEASRKYNLEATRICACCKGKRLSTGKLNGEKMTWAYYE